MKLSNQIKEAIIARILQDVPRGPDYRDQAEKLIRDSLTAKMPKEVQKLLKTEHGHRLDAHTYTLIMPGSAPNVCVRIRGLSGEKLTDEEQAQAVELVQKDWDEDQRINELERHLTRSFAAVNTRKQFVSAFPEFAKYLPEEPEKLANLPVDTTCVSALVQAGWPKKEGK